MWRSHENTHSHAHTHTACLFFVMYAIYPYAKHIYGYMFTCRCCCRVQCKHFSIGNRGRRHWQQQSRVVYSQIQLVSYCRSVFEARASAAAAAARSVEWRSALTARMKHEYQQHKLRYPGERVHSGASVRVPYVLDVRI